MDKFCITGKKGWLQEFLAFEAPCSPNKKSESLASLFRITHMRQAA